MALYQVLLRGGVAAGIEVSPGGLIVHAAPILRKSVGLRFARFQQWVQNKGGVIRRVEEGTELEPERKVN